MTVHRRPRVGPVEVVLAIIGLLILGAGGLVLITRPAAGHRAATAAATPHTSSSASPSAQPSPSPSAVAGISLDAIFGKAPDLSRIPDSRKVTMVVTGDVIPARNTNEQMLKKNDFNWPFEATTDYLHSGDIEFINLEAPLFSTCKASPTGMSFCGDPRFINGLNYAGVSVANLSNNHLTNFGPTGTNSTEQLLTAHQIQPAGLGLIAHMTVKGVRFAFLGFNGVGTAVPRAEMAREIALARPTADVVVVQFHWGKEYVLTPQSTNDAIAPDNPQEIGHLAIDDGADLVIGNHPHAVQGVEVYKGRLITYAHGNFVFDQMWTPDPGQEDPRNGVVGKYTFVDGKLAAVEYKPTRIYEYGQPRFLTGPYADYVLSLMKTSTDLIARGTTESPPSPPVAAPQ